MVPESPEVGERDVAVNGTQPSSPPVLRKAGKGLSEVDKKARKAAKKEKRKAEKQAAVAQENDANG